MQEIGVLIIGFGFVGKYMKSLFTNADIFDQFSGLQLQSGENINSKEVSSIVKKNDLSWDLGIICVPTPSLKNGQCDISEVEKSILFWKPYIKNFLIKSTIEVGTTDKLRSKFEIPIVFSPEYIGETIDHPMMKPDNKNKFIILGGQKDDINTIFKIYKTYISAEVTIYRVESKVAELCKYIENSYLAMKVLFCNEFYDIAESFGIKYDELREIWLADPRIGRSHTLVYEYDRGFGGKCLPKDINAIKYSANKQGYSSELLKFILERNEFFRRKNQKEV